jgi:hypothetical protein
MDISVTHCNFLADDEEKQPITVVTAFGFFTASRTNFCKSIGRFKIQ